MKSSKLLLGALIGAALGMAVSAAALAGGDGKDRNGPEGAEYGRSIEHKDKSDMDRRHETGKQGEAESEERDDDANDRDEKEPEQRGAE